MSKDICSSASAPYLEETMTVFETVPDQYLILSPGLTILTASNAYLTKAFPGEPLKSRSEIQGRPVGVLFDHLAASAQRDLLGSLEQVIQTGQKDQLDHLRYDLFARGLTVREAKERYFMVTHTPVLNQDGEIIYIIHKVLDVSEQIRRNRELVELRAHKEQLKQPQHFMAVAEHLPDVVTRWDKNLQLIYANAAFESKTGLSYSTFLGKTAMEMAPAEDAIPFMEKMRKVFEDGKPDTHYTPIQGPDGALCFFARLVPEKAEDGTVLSILRIATDITDLKNTEQKLKESRDLLQSVFDESPNSINVFDIIYTKSGDVEDFEILMVNDFTYKIIGDRDVIGKRYSIQFPTVLKNGVLDQFKEVALTGRPADFELWYEGEGINHWLRFIANKVGNKLVITTEDITKRKKDELALKERRDLLQSEYGILRQAEEVALIGSWEFDIPKNKMRWSDGMFDLFDLKKEAYVYPELYLKYIIPEDKSRMKAIISFIKQEFKPFQDEVTLKIKGQKRIFRIKASVSYDQESKPVKVSGVAMDITNRRATEQKLKAIEENRFQDILNAVINAQEEERTHIAEVLHNEFGQLLSVARMKIPAENFEAANLVNQAIMQVRTISYELMPDILTDFGLEFALKDMCNKKLRDAGIKYSGKIKGLGNRITPVMEVAVYRIVQELLNNTIKHSKASLVTLEVIRKDALLHMKLSDNGIGFHIENKSENSKSGFGLKYIMNRIQLHKGRLNVVALEQGSVVSIEIPLIER